jgi:hypothetical protein
VDTYLLYRGSRYPRSQERLHELDGWDRRGNRGKRVIRDLLRFSLGLIAQPGRGFAPGIGTSAVWRPLGAPGRSSPVTLSQTSVTFRRVAVGVASTRG